MNSVGMSGKHTVRFQKSSKDQYWQKQDLLCHRYTLDASILDSKKFHTCDFIK